MQTVNFNCPHCGNLMAVGTNLLGRNVRCPHCKQVVRAPAAPSETAPAAAPPAPRPSPPPAPPDTAATQVPQFKLPEQTEHHESIFGERHEEDVFGTEPLKPTVPPPVPPPPPAPYLQETVGITTEAPPRPALPPDYEPLPEDLPYQLPAARRTREPAPPPRDEEAPTEAEDEAPALRRYQSPAPKEESASTGPFAWILLGYGAFITIVAGFFAFQYFTGGSSRHPFDAIPDVYGQYEKANRRQVSYKGFPDPTAAVPPELRVKVGGELTVGDLHVKPVAVERRHNLTRVIKRPIEGDLTRQHGAEALVLKLRVKNLSADTVFHPNDPAFNRAFDRAVPTPYTALEFRNEFHYGPLPWPTEPGNDDDYIDGLGLEKDAAPLAPGAEADVFVAVAPRGTRVDVNNFGQVLHAWDRLPTTESFLWRVQLRRGLVKAEVDGKDLEMSATTVIGVAFTKGDVN